MAVMLLGRFIEVRTQIETVPGTSFTYFKDFLILFSMNQLFLGEFCFSAALFHHFKIPMTPSVDVRSSRSPPRRNLPKIFYHMTITYPNTTPADVSLCFAYSLLSSRGARMGEALAKFFSCLDKQPSATSHSNPLYHHGLAHK